MMGFVWMIYGIGLQGPLGSWKEVPGRTVLQDTNALVESEVLNDQVQVPDGVSFSEESAAVAQAFEDEGWERLDSSSQEFGQAGAAAGTFAEAVGAYAAGDFVVNGVYDTGGERYPKLFGSDSLDFLAFFHEPRHVVVELAPIIPTYTEAGRAPAAAQIDETGQRAVRLHGPRPRRPPTAGDGARHRRRRSSSSRCAGCCTAATASSPPTDPRCR